MESFRSKPKFKKCNMNRKKYLLIVSNNTKIQIFLKTIIGTFINPNVSEKILPLSMDIF